jgi:molybdopterin-containing oxidoreductase family membrane subunit
MEVTSSFHDGRVAGYRASLPELLLGVSGVSLAMLICAIAVSLLPLLPKSAP